MFTPETCEFPILGRLRSLLQMNRSLYMGCLLTRYKCQPTHHHTTKEGGEIFLKYLTLASYFSYSGYIPHGIKPPWSCISSFGVGLQFNGKVVITP